MSKDYKEEDIRQRIRVIKQYVVETQVIINKIGKIDTLDGTFYAEFFINATWLENLKQNQTLKDFQYDAKKNFNPNLLISNAIGDPIEETEYSVKKSPYANQILISERRKVAGTFYHEFDLKYFPIDVQTLTIEVKTGRSLREVTLIESKEKFSCLNPNALMNAEEWTIQSCLRVNASVIQNEISMENYSAFSVSVTASRIPRFYFYNLFFLIFLITVIGLTRFTVTCDLPQVRLIIDQMVTLTLITFKSVVNANLPNISYLTSVDKYLLFSIIFIMLQCIYDGVIGVMTPPICAAPYGFYDLMAFVSSTALIIVANFIFMIWLIFFAYKNRKHLYKQIDISNYSNSDKLFNYYANSLQSNEENFEMQDNSDTKSEDSNVSSDTNSSIYSQTLKI